MASILDAEFKLRLEMKQAELNSLLFKHDQLMNIKDDQIKFLEGKITPLSWYESGEFWFAMGVVGGILITVGSAYAIGQAAK